MLHLVYNNNNNNNNKYSNKRKNKNKKHSIYFFNILKITLLELIEELVKKKKFKKNTILSSFSFEVQQTY
jgi:hypothetical protein